MLDWLNENKEWLFGGGGIVVIGALIKLIFNFWAMFKKLTKQAEQAEQADQQERDNTREYNRAMNELAELEKQSIRIPTDEEVLTYDAKRRELFDIIKRNEPVAYLKFSLPPSLFIILIWVVIIIIIIIIVSLWFLVFN